MRVRARWTRRTQLLWLFAIIVAGFAAWLDFHTSSAADAAEPPLPASEATVDFEVVE